MAPILILYGSKSGQTEKVSQALADTLRGEGAEVDVRIAAAPGDTTRDYEYTDWDDLHPFARSFHERAYGPRAKTAAG